MLFRSTRQFKAPGRLFTFVLDGTAKLEPVRGIEHDPLTPVAYKATAAQLEHGSALFARRCSMCHGTAAASGGTIADLRYAQPATYDNMDQIVRQGAYQQLGMPKFDFLTEEDLAALKALRANRSPWRSRLAWMRRTSQMSVPMPNIMYQTPHLRPSDRRKKL